jgi:hypothetical protein
MFKGIREGFAAARAANTRDTGVRELYNEAIESAKTTLSVKNNIDQTVVIVKEEIKSKKMTPDTLPFVEDLEEKAQKALDAANEYVLKAGIYSTHPANPVAKNQAENAKQIRDIAYIEAEEAQKALEEKRTPQIASQGIQGGSSRRKRKTRRRKNKKNKTNKR